MDYKISSNFSMREFTRSATAHRMALDNTPSHTVEERIERLVTDILQPLRDAWGAPIIVASGYRCTELNRAVGGVTNSDHKYGSAADIKSIEDTPGQNKKLFELAVRMMKDGRIRNVKQILDEYNYDWIHISRQDGRSAKFNQVLHIK